MAPAWTQAAEPAKRPAGAPVRQLVNEPVNEPASNAGAGQELALTVVAIVLLGMGMGSGGALGVAHAEELPVRMLELLNSRQRGRPPRRFALQTQHIATPHRPPGAAGIDLWRRIDVTQRALYLELQSAHEDVRSMNQGLQAVNGELEIKLDDLTMTKSDQRNLREGDAGSPPIKLTRTLDCPQLLADLLDKLHTLAPHVARAHAADGHWFATRIIPNRSIDNVLDGAVVSLIDVTAQRATSAQVAANRGRPDA